MEDDIKLSVVVSCYKQEEYVAECLKSILDQKCNFNYEIIVADDFSPDKTREEIIKFYKKHPEKIKLLFQEKNVGAAKNYFSLHALAKGKYVAHIDGDDIMLPGKLQAQVDIMEANPNCNIVIHRARYFSDDRSYEDDTGPLLNDNKIIFFTPQQLARWGTISAHSSFMYRRSSRKTWVYKQDFMEWFFAIESIMGGVGAYINEVLIEYRCNPTAGAYLSTTAGRKKASLIIIGHVIDYFESIPEFKTDLYAQNIINIFMYIKKFHEVKWFMVKFLFKNIVCFRLGKTIDVIKIRRMVGLSKKIR